MKASQFLLLGFCAAANATAFSSEDTLFASLKRQEPGTPAYNCHDNCGAATTQSKNLPTPCTSPTFLANYANCLQCSGPSNHNIWRYYGRTLAAAGEACGLETQPKSGEQGDVGPAVKDGEGGAIGSGSANETATPVSSTSGSVAVATTNATMNAVDTATPQPSTSMAQRPSQSINGTASATASAPVQVSTNAAAAAAAGLNLNDAGILGAIFVGVLFGL